MDCQITPVKSEVEEEHGLSPKKWLFKIGRHERILEKLENGFYKFEGPFAKELNGVYTGLPYAEAGFKAYAAAQKPRQTRGVSAKKVEVADKRKKVKLTPPKKEDEV